MEPFEIRVLRITLLNCLNSSREWAELPLGRQTLHHDWLSGYRGLQTPLFILSLGIELAHSFNLSVSGDGEPQWSERKGESRWTQTLCVFQAAWLMYGIEHFDDVNLLDATLDDLREFVAGLDDDGLEELQRLADEFEIRDGVVWLGDIRLTPLESAFPRSRWSRVECGAG